MLNSMKMNCFYLLLLAQTSVAATSVQYYQAQIPQTSRSCEAEAQAMATRFSAATKASVRGSCVEVYQTHTSNGNRTVYSIEVSYPAEKAFNPASSVYGVGYSDWDTTGKFLGLYLDYDSCVADLPRRAEEYRQHTRLIPVAAFCERSANLSRADYILQVDGFGQPKQTLNVLAPDLLPFPTDAALANEVKNVLPRFGAQLVAEQGSRLFYYSEKPIHLRGSAAAYFDNPDHCRAQIQEAQKIFTDQDAAPANVHCVVTPHTHSETTLAVVYASIDLRDSFKGTERYPSFEECLLNRDRALNRAARTHSWVVGGICQREIFHEDSYVLEIYQKDPIESRP
jgi:hypothetical protein